MSEESNKYRILVVDDEPNNLQLMRQILKGSYQLAMAPNGYRALAACKALRPDLILLDVRMPGMDGFEVCKQLKADPAMTKVPVIFVTTRSEVEDESLGFAVGGVDYITKPISKPIVLARVATHLALYDQQRACEKIVEKRTHELESTQIAAIHMLGEAGHYNDTDTGVHIWRMASYAAALARQLGWSVAQTQQLELAAPMHDTGKIGIPDAILKKPAKLSEKEWKIMYTHPLIGHSILCKSDTPLFRMAAEIALHHHEKWDGSGYPNRLIGKAIPESARIVAIADVFDALTMQRSYKPAWPVATALAEIQKNSNHHFDPEAVRAFFAIEAEIKQIKGDWAQKEK